MIEDLAKLKTTIIENFGTPYAVNDLGVAAREQLV